MSGPSLPPVLYVEDEENDVLLMKLAFKRAGITHPLQVAHDGKEALDYLYAAEASAEATRRTPCIVLLDLNLPRVSGLEVLQRMRERPELREIPVVIFSSSGQPGDQQRASELGAADYIVKQASLEHLVTIVKDLNRRWLATCTGTN